MDSINHSNKEELISDITFLDELKNEGFKNILNRCKDHNKEQTSEHYLERKEFFSTYFVLYLSSGNMKVNNLNKDSEISKSNLAFIKDLLLNERILFEEYFYSDINKFTHQAFKNILDILQYYSTVENIFSLEETLDIFTYFLENSFSRNLILNLFWKAESGKLMEETFLGYILRLYLNVKKKVHLWGKENDFHKILGILVKNYKNEMIDWYINLLEYNKNYGKTAYILDLNKDPDLSSLKFLLVSFEIILFYYYDSRINFFKTTDNLNHDIFEDEYYNSWKISCDKKKTNLYSVIFKLIIGFFKYSLCPVIEKIGKNNRNIQQFNDLIDLEENSVRWGSTFSSMKKIYINKLNKKITNLKLENKGYTNVTDSSIFIRYLRFVINDLSKVIINNSEDKLPENIKEYVGNVLDFTKNQLKSNILGDNSSHIINLSIHTLIDNDEKTFVKIKFLNFLTVNNHIVSDILINSDNNNNLKYSIQEYLDCLINFYHNIDSNGSNYYNKMTARYKINGVISKYVVLYKNLLDKKETISIFDEQYKWKESLTAIFNKNNIWENLSHLLISDTSFYFEEIVSAIKKINELKNITNYSQILLNEDRVQQQVITMSTYSIYFESNILLMDQLLETIPKCMKSSLNMNKLITSLTFYVFSILDDKNSIIYNFDFTKYKINFTWKVVLRIVFAIFCSKWSEDDQVTINKTICDIPQWYSPKIFNKLESIIKSYGDCPYNIGDFVQKVEKYKEELKEIEIDLVDLPSEFCDPIMMTPIIKPVLLPESKIFMDEDVITSHLINDETDPFNRTKLTREELSNFNQLPETVTKVQDFIQRLEKWKNDQKSKKS